MSSALVARGSASRAPTGEFGASVQKRPKPKSNQRKGPLWTTHCGRPGWLKNPWKMIQQRYLWRPPAFLCVFLQEESRRRAAKLDIDPLASLFRSLSLSFLAVSISIIQLHEYTVVVVSNNSSAESPVLCSSSGAITNYFNGLKGFCVGPCIVAGNSITFALAKATEATDDRVCGTARRSTVVLCYCSASLRTSKKLGKRESTTTAERPSRRTTESAAFEAYLLYLHYPASKWREEREKQNAKRRPALQ